MFLGPDRLFSVSLGDLPLTIGRRSDCDICLSLPEVSRLHAVIRRTGGSWSIEDRSRNGLLVNGRRRTAGSLALGDEVRIASYSLHLEPLERSRDLETLVDPMVTRPGADMERLSTERERTDAGGLGEMIGSSEAMKEVYGLVRRLAPTSDPVLILGETGTGKELVARALHSLGPTASGPWVPVNCAAISPELAESELFGHERDAFTGALRRREGKFVAASGGTLFLDEIGEAPLPLQSKLLRALESREIVRVGGIEAVPVRARVVAATNRSLREDVRSGRFRQDLFFRLHVLPIRIPPLRERRGDISALIRHFLAEEPPSERIRLTAEAVEFLERWSWPGNVRELRNLVRSLVMRRPSGPVGAALVREALDIERSSMDLSAPLEHPSGPIAHGSERDRSVAGEALREAEKRAVLRMLSDCRGNKREAARRLGIAVSTLYAKIARYHLEDSIVRLRPAAARRRSRDDGSDSV